MCYGVTAMSTLCRNNADVVSNVPVLIDTKAELTLEQTQQGVSDEVLVGPQGFKDTYKYGNGGTCDKVLKLKNFKKDDYTSFQDQGKYEHVGLKVTSTQEGKISQDDDERLYSADNLKKLKDHTQVKPKGTSSSLKSKDRYAYHKLNDKDSRP
ncbi:hypothetical protein Tco_0196215 [Tanacetum coccineum]